VQCTIVDTTPALFFVREENVMQIRVLSGRQRIDAEIRPYTK
jgi:hypothetical protein